MPDFYCLLSESVKTSPGIWTASISASTSNGSLGGRDFLSHLESQSQNQSWLQQLPGCRRFDYLRAARGPKEPAIGGTDVCLRSRLGNSMCRDLKLYVQTSTADSPAY